jgi:hypothetical protein
MRSIFGYVQDRLDYGLLTALAIPLLALLPLLTHAGLPNTADGPVHLMRQVELNRAWAEGNFYPRWGTDLALGHGMPIFSYAPPFLYQLTQLFHLTGLPLDEAMKGVLVVDFLLYSAGMFLFARRIFGPYPALVAAAVYVYAPYRLREAYIQGNYGQFSGLAFYPLIFWAFHGLVATGRRRYLFAAALSLAGLLFSHNISFMLFTPIFAAYLLFLILPTSGNYQLPITNYQLPITNYQLPITNYPSPHLPISPSPHLKSKIQNLAAAILLGLGLAAIFWLPAFGERHDIKLEGITQGFFDFRENFISLAELFSSPSPLDLAAMNPEFPLSLGLAQLIGAAAGIVALLFWASALRRPTPAIEATSAPSEVDLRRNTAGFATRLSPFSHTLFFTGWLLLYAFLALPYSQSAWENAPLIELAEFPWRMLGPAIFCAASLAAAGVSWLPPAKASTPLLTGCLLFGVIGLNAHYLYPSQFISWGTPAPAAAFAYEAASGAIGTTSTGEFLPRWARQHPEPETLWPDYEAGRPPQKLDPAGLPAGATVAYLSHRSETDILQVETPAPFVATLRTLYWPGWQVYLDGQPALLTITENTGLIQTEIPAGRHTLTLSLESTPLRTTGLWLTLITAAILVLIAIYSGVKRLSHHNRISDQEIRTTHHQPRLSPTFFGLFAALLLALYLLSRPLAPLFVLRSDPDQPQPAAKSLQVDFADQIRLVGADSPPWVIELPAEGEAELTAVLYWRALQPVQTNYSVFLHLDAPDGQTFATVDEVNPEDIPTRNWPPGLYLRNPLQLKLPATLPPIRYELTTGIYDRETGARLPVWPGEASSFQLGPVWLTRPHTSRPVEPAIAHFGPHITLHRATLTENILTLFWQTGDTLSGNQTIFVHLLDAGGNFIGQADGAPYEGLYPLSHWLPGQLIVDSRTLDLGQQPATVIIGVYDPATGQRLPALDGAGQPLPDNSFILTVTSD